MSKNPPESLRQSIYDLMDELSLDQPDKKKLKSLCHSANLPYEDDTVSLMAHVLVVASQIKSKTSGAGAKNLFKIVSEV